MLNKLAILLSMSLIGIGSANAATLFMPAVSGVLDQAQVGKLAGNQNGCVADIAYGRMEVQAYPNQVNTDCFMSFPINLPVGTTIDGVEISYRDDSGAIGRSIVAVLVSNGIKPYTGAHLLGVASDNFVSPTQQQLFANMGSLSTPVVSGNIYWVQVSSHRVTEINYVAVTYH